MIYRALQGHRSAAPNIQLPGWGFAHDTKRDKFLVPQLNFATENMALLRKRTVSPRCWRPRQPTAHRSWCNWTLRLWNWSHGWWMVKLMMLIGFFSAQNAGILNRVSIPFKLTFKANKLGVQMAMVRPGPTLQLGRRRLDVWDRWLDHQPRKRKRPWPAWAMKYQEWTSWSTSRRCRCGTGDGVIPLAIKRWCQLMVYDGLCMFMLIWTCYPFFLIRGWPENRTSISYRSTELARTVLWPQAPCRISRIKGLSCSLEETRRMSFSEVDVILDET